MDHYQTRGILARSIFLLAIVSLLAACGGVTPAAAPLPTAAATPQVDYWPTDAWRTSTPEAQGMDSKPLAEMMARIRESGQVHGVVVVRNGYIVAEAYAYPYLKEVRHFVASVTKSFTSALVGIAIQQGHIKGISERALDIFAGRSVANLDPAKKGISVGHLLAMSSGLDWPEWSGFNPMSQMTQVQDWVQFVLDRPMAAAAGATWNYNSGGSHLLSAMVQERSGMSTSDFARRYLFEPLGMTDVKWAADPAGIAIGACGLFLTPRDMARFGLLYLNQGVWDGLQVVPADWVEASILPYKDAYDGDAFLGGYGFQWWIDPSGKHYSARGAFGQYIFVLPVLNMVVVFTSDGQDERTLLPIELLETFILPAALSSWPIPENPEGLAMLQSFSQAVGQPPAPGPVPPLPEMAQRIAGKSYLLEENPYGWQSLSLDFQGAEAFLSLAYGEQSQSLPLGLDGVYRMADVERLGEGDRYLGTGCFRAGVDGYVGLTGAWRNDDTFSVKAHLPEVALGPAVVSDKSLQIRFAADGSRVGVSGWLGGREISGTLQDGRAVPD